MKKTSIFVSTLFFSTLLICCGNIEKKTKSEDTKPNEIKLNKINAGDVLIFGEGCDKACDSIYLVFVSKNKAKLNLTHSWEMNGNSGYYKKEQYVGDYNVEFLPSNAIISDNEYWPIIDSVIVLSNEKYGYDNGYLYLSKKYAISKCKSSSSNEIQGPSIYQWLDPINYPSRNGEYSFLNSIPLNQMKKK
jgi:hypothetical protein